MFSTTNFIVRWILCLFVIFATYNTTGVSYFHWIFTGEWTDLPLKVFVGILLLTALATFAQATWRSFGPTGISLSMMFLTSVVWAMVDFRWLNLNNDHAIATTTGFILGTLFALGVSWSHQRTRLSGQVDARDVNLY